MTEEMDVVQEEIKTGINTSLKITFRKGEILRSVMKPYYLEAAQPAYYYMVEDVINGNIIETWRVHKTKTGWKKLFKEHFLIIDFMQGYLRRTNQNVCTGD